MLPDRRGGPLRVVARFAATFAHSLVSQLAVSVAAALILKFAGQAWLMPPREAAEHALAAPASPVSMTGRAQAAAADVVALAAYPWGPQEALWAAPVQKQAAAETGADGQKAAPGKTVRKKHEDGSCPDCVAGPEQPRRKDDRVAAQPLAQGPGPAPEEKPPAEPGAAAIPAVAAPVPAAPASAAPAPPTMLPVLAQVPARIIEGVETARDLVVSSAELVTSPLARILPHP